MDNPEIIWSKVQCERCSADTKNADKYENENFLNTLGQLMSQLKSQRRLSRISRERERSSVPIVVQTDSNHCDPPSICALGSS